VLTVRDTGTGIPEHELPNVFARFHRIQGARSRTHEGSGIGLALVHELVRLHGGTIEVASQLDVGTTFTVRLPYGSSHLPAEHVHTNRSLTPSSGGADPFVQEALRWLPNQHDPRESVLPEPAASPALAPALGATSDARIVLADDNSDMREYVARLLGQYWTVETVANGEQALEAVRRNPPELLLTDVMMPELDGFGLLRMLREDESTRTLPVILLSARAGEESRIEGLSAGADDYMVKPFAARELIARVGAHLALGRARTETRAAHTRLRALFAQAPVAVSVVRGPALTFELTNVRYERMVGRTGLVGKTMRAAFPELPVDAPLFTMLDEVRLTGAAFTANEYHVALDRSASGKVEDVYFFLTAQPVREPDGTIGSIMTVAVDVTQQVMMRREIEALSREREVLLTNEKQARNAAESANRSKDEFLAMLGHELRNPLAPIRTALNLIRQRHPDIALSERTVIERQVEHLVRLVDDLLDIARITGGKVVLKKSTVELSELVAKAVEVASPLLEQRRHELAIEVERSGLVVEVDPTRLTQVIANLLINAAKYTEPAGRVWIAARREGDLIALHVRDSGLGISPGMLPRVFDLFVQEAQASDRPQGGLGLGLAIVKSLITMHGGSVAAQSEGLGRGSTFTIRLPAAHAVRASDAPAALEAAPAPPTRTLRVLIVDDNLDAAEMLAEWVQLLGYEVRVAPDGPTALELVREYCPDTALLDLGLPVMDGYELARRLRAQPGLAGIKLIAATGYGQESDRARTAQAGFDLHFVKPLDLQLLTQALAGGRS
jgi:signal transduction histidine kinase/response regulator RpfG family c-di-GMP phosphodiesterase